MSIALRNATVRGAASPVDVIIGEGGRITTIELAHRGKVDQEYDVTGHMVIPGLVDPHVHLDKSLLRGTMPPNKSGTLQEAIEITNLFKKNYDPAEVAARAVEVLREAVLNGTTHVRCFVDVGTIGGLKPMQGLLAAREQVRGLVDVQLVAFPQEGILRDAGADGLMDEALAMGADVVGGLPWYEYDDQDARQHVDICFALAKKFDRPIHMLVDDTDNPNSRSLEYLALATMRNGFQGKVAASHCGALAAYDDTHATKVIGMVAEAGVSIVSNAHISLMMAGRYDHEPKRRGITRVRELMAAGVNVASGQDDVFDPYYPFGKPDQLEVAVIGAHVSHFGLPEELDRVLDMVTGNAARVLALEGYGVVPGALADLVVVEGRSVAEVLRHRKPRRFVFKRGRLVAQSQLQQKLE